MNLIWEPVKSFESKLYSAPCSGLLKTLTHVLLHPGSSNLSISQLPFRSVRLADKSWNCQWQQWAAGGVSFNSFSAIVTESFHTEEWDSPWHRQVATNCGCGTIGTWSMSLSTISSCVVQTQVCIPSSDLFVVWCLIFWYLPYLKTVSVCICSFRGSGHSANLHQFWSESASDQTRDLLSWLLGWGDHSWAQVDAWWPGGSSWFIPCHRRSRFMGRSTWRNMCSAWWPLASTVTCPKRRGRSSCTATTDAVLHRHILHSFASSLL